MMVWVLCGVCWKRHQNGEEEEDGREKEKKWGSVGRDAILTSGVW